ncbi:MAG: hypothetical protein BWY70_00253 [Bacteroidetes bacterium ADurb.Bin408]|nr:MAG: hypothetical protein BWY70_00253 [Bacteroidetes bacterium ADurb.Bin408]
MKKLLIFLSLIYMVASCAYEPRKSMNEPEKTVISTNAAGQGFGLEVEIEKGPAHNHPLMAIWLEDTAGRYIQTLYVAQSVAKGFFQHGDKTGGKWLPGPIRRPATLPYWAHKRNVKESDGMYMPSQQNPIPDAFTGATPQGSFVLKTKTDTKNTFTFKVLLEINQSWDWNTYWHNSKYPYDNDYKSSSQPALVYEALVDTRNTGESIPMKLIGHSHWSGKTGELFTDLSTITTAKDIVKSAVVKVVK